MTKRLGALFLLLSLIGSPAVAQVKQSGHITPGHAAKWVTNGVVGDAGGAAGGPPGTGLTELGITNTGLPSCVTSGPTTLPYYRLCVGANALSGGGLISYDALAGATPLPLRFEVNGAFFPLQSPLPGVASSVQANVGAFVPDSSPFPQFIVDPTSAYVAAVLGSTATPYGGLNATAIFQRNGSVTQPDAAPWGPAVLASTHTGSDSYNGGHAVAMLAVTTDQVGEATNGANFNQGAEAACEIVAPARKGFCEGMGAEVDAFVPFDVIYAYEADTNNYSGVANPATGFYDRFHFADGFRASCGDHGALTGHQPCDSAFTVNAFNYDPWHWGFLVPQQEGTPGNFTVDWAAFENMSTNVPYGLKLDLGSYTVASIIAPNFQVNQLGIVNLSKVLTQPTTEFPDPPSITSGFGGAGQIIEGTDMAGRLVVGAGGASTGLITWRNDYVTTNNPVCIVQNETTANVLVPFPTRSNLLITGTMSEGDIIEWLCVGIP